MARGRKKKIHGVPTAVSEAIQGFDDLIPNDNTPLPRKKMGRKSLDPELDKIIKLAELGATHQEIAHVMNMSTDTLVDRFSEVIAKGYSNLRISLRRKQVLIARSGNVQMNIWLDKNFLGQSDRKVIEFSTHEELDSSQIQKKITALSQELGLLPKNTEVIPSKPDDTTLIPPISNA